MFQFKSDRLNLRSQKSLVVLSLATVLLTSACTSSSGTSTVSQVVTNVSVKTYTQSGDEWAQVTAVLNTNAYQVAAVNVPVTNPTTHVEYAQLTIVPTLCSGTCTANTADLTVAIDISAATKMAGTNPELPNGTPLPVGGLTNATTVVIPIAKTNAQLYFSFGPGVAMLGTTVSFSAMNSVGTYVPGVDIFAPIPAGPVNIIAGIYAGSAPSTTGVGLFVDLSSVINQAPQPAALAEVSSGAQVMHELADNHGSEIHSVLVMKPIMPKYEEGFRLYSKILELGLEHKVLDTNTNE